MMHERHPDWHIEISRNKSEPPRWCAYIEDDDAMLLIILRYGNDPLDMSSFRNALEYGTASITTCKGN